MQPRKYISIMLTGQLSSQNEIFGTAFAGHVDSRFKKIISSLSWTKFDKIWQWRFPVGSERDVGVYNHSMVTYRVCCCCPYCLLLSNVSVDVTDAGYHRHWAPHSCIHSATQFQRQQQQQRSRLSAARNRHPASAAQRALIRTSSQIRCSNNAVAVYNAPIGLTHHCN